jgi:nitrogen regulatory protein P-II 1
MKLLVIVLNDREKLEDVLAVLPELDITGGTIIETQGMAQVLAAQVPIFAGLRQLITEAHAASATVFALSQHDDIVSRVHRLLKRSGIDFSEPGTGALFSVPVDKVIGSEDTLI